MKQSEILNEKLEFQIETMFDTIVKIQEIEVSEGPASHIGEWHQKALSMCFHHILMRHAWDKMNKTNLSKEEKMEYVTEIGNMTHEHYKNLYGFNSKK